VYVKAPFAVRLEELPMQIAVGLDTAVIVGIGVTMRFTVLVFVQPSRVLPVTV
jgi:hypothetical protein